MALRVPIMPRVNKQRERYYMERIRAILAFSPQMTNIAIRERLESDYQDPITLDREYIGKLKLKLQNQRKHNISVIAVENRIAQMQDTAAAVVEKMVEILLSPATSDKDKINAGKIILEADRALFQAEMDAGIFERNLGSLALKHKLVLDPDRRLAISRAMQNLGVIKPTIDVQPTLTASPTGHNATD